MIANGMTSLWCEMDLGALEMAYGARQKERFSVDSLMLQKLLPINDMAILAIIRQAASSAQRVRMHCELSERQALHLLAQQLSQVQVQLKAFTSRPAVELCFEKFTWHILIGPCAIFRSHLLWASIWP